MPPVMPGDAQVWPFPGTDGLHVLADEPYRVADKLMKAEAIARRGTFADGSIQQVETAPDEHGKTKEERHARVKGISFRNKDGSRKSMAMDGGEGGMPFVSIPDMKKFAEHHAQEERDDEGAAKSPSAAGSSLAFGFC